jgi:hypothetical protein
MKLLWSNLLVVAQYLLVGVTLAQKIVHNLLAQTCFTTFTRSIKTTRTLQRHAVTQGLT